MSDIALAVAHHLLVFALVALIAAELVLLRPGLEPAAIRRLGRIDLAYGGVAGLIVLVGFGRALFAAKGWEYYAGNSFFWAKIGTFLLIALLSLPPTITYIRWRKDQASPSAEAVAKVRRFLIVELLLFAPLLTLAAGMARGFGMR